MRYLLLLLMIIFPIFSANAQDVNPSALNPGALQGMSLEDIPYSDVVKKAKNGELQEILIRSGQGYVFPQLYIRKKDGTILHSFMPTSRLDERIMENGVTIRADNGSSAQKITDWISSGLWVVMMLATIFLVWFLVKGQSKGNALGKIESNDRLKGINFSNVAGQKEAKRELKEIVDFLTNPDKFKAIGAHIPKGVLLEGEPGNGKTLLARALAGESKVNFFHLDASGLVEMFAGLGPRRVRAAFKLCRKNAPCILFIDELDSIGKKRGQGAMGAQNEYDSILNQFLTEMDGIKSVAGKEVIVIGATNRADMLDPALTRPGRLDRHIVVTAPTLYEIEEILQVHTKEVKLDSSVNLLNIAKMIIGCSGAEIANIVNEAAINAVKDSCSTINEKHFIDARDRFLLGLARESHIMSEAERLTSAYHEAGHAILSSVTPSADPVHKVTILPRGQSLGSVISVPERDHLLLSKEKLIGRIHVFMAGRAAEHIIFGPHKITTGAREDFKQATYIAIEMMGRLGMGDQIGFMANGDEPGLSSERQKDILEKEVQIFLSKCMKDVENILQANREKLEILVQRLLIEETIIGEDLKLLLK